MARWLFAVCSRRAVEARRQRGAVAVIVAATMIALLVTGAIVLDLGMARVDRSINKSAADAAAAAGLQAADAGSGDVYNSSAVCAAYQFLIKQRQALSGLPAGICALPNTSATCTPGDPTSNVSYSGTTTFGSSRYDVWIQMPYRVTDTTGGGSFAVESTNTLSSDPGDPTMQGCDQIGVIIKASTQPGLGKLVSNSDIVTRIRSVGRVKVGSGDVAPALLLLERTRCGTLTVGSAGSPSLIQVKGTATTPGTIHADSDASDSGCNSINGQLFQGKQANGIVAYGAANGVSGIVSSAATLNGKAANIVADSTSNVYATTAVDSSTTGTVSPVTGRKQVTRRPVDRRYLPGVTAASQAAYSVWNTNHATAPGFTQRVGCNPTMSSLATMTQSQSLYVDCPGSGITLSGSIGAGTIYFHGFIKGGSLSMPNAQKVYIDDTNDSGNADSSSAVNLNNNTSFCVRPSAGSCSTSNPAAGQCSNLPTGSATAQAQMIVRRGMINGGGTSSLLRLCNTRVILEGGDIGAGTASSPGACLPLSNGTAPTSTPCPSSPGPSTGDSQIATTGVLDWTAPNAYSDMKAAGLTSAQQQTLWDGGEDLALWDESYGSGSDYKMAGGGLMHVAGVFMVPNAYPFNITGGGVQDLSNAQYIIRGFAVAGGATLTMKVDPNNVVAMPALFDFRMVR